MADTLMPAFVLHRRPFRESSLLVDLLTRDAGRICVVARGVRKSRRGNAQRLQPFVPLQVAWRGRGELPTLSRAEAEGASLLTHGSHAALVALYLSELLIRLTAREDPHPRLFSLYMQTLVALESGAMEPALRRFELGLLEELGYGLELRQTADTGEPVREDGHYRFDLESGPVAWVAGTEPEKLSGGTLLALADDRLETAAQLREAKALLARVMGHYLGHQPLKTRELLLQMGRSTTPKI